MEPNLVREIPSFLATLAALAGAAALPHFRRIIPVENKALCGFDPVTLADREVERVLREAIHAKYPTHAILGEEFGTQAGSAQYRWVIDPIDGTRAFVSGLPTWGTLIGLCDGDRPCYGLMAQPYVGEMFIGGEGEAWQVRGAHRQRLRTSRTSTLSTASLFATSPEMFRTPQESKAFEQVAHQARMIRFGADCYAYCLLAAGFVDLVIEAGLGFYDIAALVPIIESAGGVVTDWQGNPVRGGGCVVAAANAQLHRAALDLLHAGS